MTQFEFYLIAGLLTATFAAWATVASRLFRGEPIVAYEPRRPVPWSGWVTVALAVAYFLMTLGAAVVAQLVYWGTVGGVPDDVMDVPELKLILKFHVLSTLGIAVTTAMVLMATAPETRLRDVGLARPRPKDLGLGGFGFFAVVPPVLTLQVMLTKLIGESQHPLIEGWKQGGDSELFLWTWLAAVIGAPLVEELFFRGLLQGSLERVFQRRGPSSPEAAPDEPAPSVAESFEGESNVALRDIHVPPDVAPSAVERPSWAPVFISSALFAIVHTSGGPDPIPIFFLALGLGYLYRQTHRLWPGIIVHMLLNAFSTGILVFQS